MPVASSWCGRSTQSVPDWVIDEANEAKKKGVLVPVLLDRVEQPMGFRSIHAADLSEWSKKAKSSAVNVLMDDISEVLKRHGAGTRKRSSPKPRPLKEEPPRTKLKDFQALIKSLWLWFIVSGLGALVLSGGLMLVSATAKRSEDRKVRTISLPDNTAVSVTFVNKSSKASTVSWIDPDGKEIRYCVLEPDQSCNQRTYIEHYWIIRSIDGREIGTYVAGQDGKSAVVKILEEE